MFDRESAYWFHNLGCDRNNLFESQIQKFIYRFNYKNASIVEPYYVHVDHFQGDLMVVKFFPKRLKNEGIDKYRKVIDSVLFNRILASVIRICEDIQQRHPNASFVFQAAPKINSDNSIEILRITQRYRIYLHALKNRVSSDRFHPVFIERYSICCLVNKSNIDPIRYLKESDLMLRRESSEYSQYLPSSDDLFE
mgnify:CR=1 FL=1